MQRNHSALLFLLGAIVAAGMILLAIGGNPGNMALCTACFLRDIVGALKFHSNAATQYFRPEILGIVLGAFILALGRQEFKTTSSNSSMVQFVLGNILMIGALVFLGCTLRMVIRMATGEIAAWVGFVGLLLGVFTGTAFVKRGFSLTARTEAPRESGYIFPTIMVLIFVLTLLAPELFAWSESGPGSMNANRWLSLAIGLLFGGIAFYTRLCFTGSFRDAIVVKDASRLMPVLGIFFGLLLYNLITGNFAIQPFGPIAHAQHLWNILSMFVVGFAGVLANGCPVRQVVLAGSGSTDGAIATLGMMSGAAIAHNFGLASSGASTESIGGPGLNGKIAIIACIIILFGVAFAGLKQRKAVQ